MKYLFSIALLVSPFVFMILVNETARLSIKEKPYAVHGITTINPVNKAENKCTWICHNNTVYCKANHVKYLKNYFFFSDIFYFGIIGLLALTGNYGLANIIFLVVLIPLTIWYLLVKSIFIQLEIRKLKRNSRKIK